MLTCCGRIDPMILHIDTKDKDLIEVYLKNKTEIIAKCQGHNKFGSQILLPLIKDVCNEAKINLKDISEVEVSTGPGSYTGLRVGVAVANALGFALGVKVNGKKIETQLEYS